MNLKDFEGEHYLSGIDTGNEQFDSGGYTEERGYILFQLDGKNYKAIEDPQDGYRSYLEEIEETELVPSYIFSPQKVIGKYIDKDESYGYVYEVDFIEFRNPDTNELVLRMGTDNSDDYYPTCILAYYPENLPINKDNNI